MPKLDRDKLLKLLALMDSDQDGEALAAARKAAAMVAAAGLRWEDVIVATTDMAQPGWHGAGFWHSATQRPDAGLSDIEVIDALLRSPLLSHSLKQLLLDDRKKALGGVLSRSAKRYVREIYCKIVAPAAEKEGPATRA